MTEQIAGFDVEHLHGPKKTPYAENELVVVCLVRDGLPWVRSFVEHYFSLGAKHIVFLDNVSTDGTVEVLESYNRVTVLRTEVPFRGNEGDMRRYLLGRFGRNRWCLCVDVDELFDYPHSDVVPVGSLLDYLNGKSYTAVGALMLDMFPERLLLGGEDDPEGAWREAHRFYDVSGIKRVRLSDEDALFRRNVFDDEGTAVRFRGGIRDDVFGFPEGSREATKYPLLFSDGRVRHYGPHQVRNARVADLTCALLHYKFYAFSLQRYRRNVLEQKKTKRDPTEHEHYSRVLKKNVEIRPRRATSREISGVNDLLENGLLFASEDYTGLAEALRRAGGDG